MNIGAVDLFCGVGGLTYGLQKAGIKVVAGIDVDKSCEYAFTQNNKSEFVAKNIEDIKGMDIKRLLRGYNTKVLVGCAPCQPFSRHQKDKQNRNKHKDWKLLYEFSRLIKEVKPHLISMENVPELAKEKVFYDFIETLKEEGYYYSYSIIKVADYGVPQHRRRLILLASRRKPIKIIEKTHQTYVSVRDTISDLPIVEAGQSSIIDRLHVASSLSDNNLLRIEHSIPGGTWRDWPKELVLQCHKEKSGKSYPSVYGRMIWDGLAPTITTQFTNYGTGRFGHPVQNRALTLREGALLQSFPKAYSFISDNQIVNMKSIARHIGNAVPPRIGEVIGISLLENTKKRKYIKREV